MLTLVIVLLVSTLFWVWTIEWGRVLEIEYLSSDRQLYEGLKMYKRDSNYTFGIRKYMINNLTALVIATLVVMLASKMNLYVAIFAANALVMLVRMAIVKWNDKEGTQKLSVFAELWESMVILMRDAFLLSLAYLLIKNESIFLSILASHLLVRCIFSVISLMTLWMLEQRIQKEKRNRAIEEAFPRVIKEFVKRTQEKLKREESGK